MHSWHILILWGFLSYFFLSPFVTDCNRSTNWPEDPDCHSSWARFPWKAAVHLSQRWLLPWWEGDPDQAGRFSQQSYPRLPRWLWGQPAVVCLSWAGWAADPGTLRQDINDLLKSDFINTEVLWLKHEHFFPIWTYCMLHFSVCDWGIRPVYREASCGILCCVWG